MPVLCLRFFLLRQFVLVMTRFIKRCLIAAVFQCVAWKSRVYLDFWLDSISISVFGFGFGTVLDLDLDLDFSFGVRIGIGFFAFDLARYRVADLELE
jgi:hypothetical protein